MPAADKKPIQNDGIEDKKFMDFKFDVGVFEMNIYICFHTYISVRCIYSHSHHRQRNKDGDGDVNGDGNRWSAAENHG